MIAGDMSFSSIKGFEAKFIYEGQDKILHSLETFFWLGQGRVSVCSLGGALYWMKCMVEMDSFVSNKDESSSVIAVAGPVWKKDSLMSTRDWWVGEGGMGGSDYGN